MGYAVCKSQNVAYLSKKILWQRGVLLMSLFFLLSPGEPKYLISLFQMLNIWPKLDNSSCNAIS
jgi:hypothetical protein